MKNIFFLSFILFSFQTFAENINTVDCPKQEIIDLPILFGLHADIGKSVCHQYLNTYLEKFNYNGTYFDSSDENLPNISKYLELKATLLYLTNEILTDIVGSQKNSQQNDLTNTYNLNNILIFKRQLELDQIHLLTKESSIFNNVKYDFGISRATINPASDKTKITVRPHLNISSNIIEQLQTNFTLTKMNLFSIIELHHELSRSPNSHGLGVRSFHEVVNSAPKRNYYYQRFRYINTLVTNKRTNDQDIKEFLKKNNLIHQASGEDFYEIMANLGRLDQKLLEGTDIYQLSDAKLGNIIDRKYLSDLTLDQEIRLARACERKNLITKRNDRTPLDKRFISSVFRKFQSGPRSTSTLTSPRIFKSPSQVNTDDEGNVIYASNPNRKNYSFSSKQLEFLKFNAKSQIKDSSHLNPSAFNDGEYIYVKYTHTTPAPFYDIFNIVGDKAEIKYIKVKKSQIKSSRSRFEIAGTKTPNRISIELVNVNGHPQVQSSITERDVYAYSLDKNRFDTNLASHELIESMEEIDEVSFNAAKKNMMILDLYYGATNF
jgi:hypothetical protein